MRAADTKEGAVKAAPLTAEIVDELRALPRNVSGRVFRCRRDWYSRAFGTLCASLKPPIVDLHFHDLRHTALTNMRRRGLDLVTMAAISGHKTLDMLRRYQHVSEDDLRAAMDTVSGHAAGRDRS
jgi:integrase